MEIRLARPQGGQDRYCVVWTCGVVPIGTVEMALGRLIQAPVRAFHAMAFDSRSGRDEAAVFVPVPPWV
eukprot:11214596-Lingulodinium_polyedra.AAC.1